MVECSICVVTGLFDVSQLLYTILILFMAGDWSTACAEVAEAELQLTR